MVEVVLALLAIVLGVAGYFVGTKLGGASGDKFKALLDASDKQLEQSKVTATTLETELRTAREEAIRLTGQLGAQEQVMKEREEAFQTRLDDLLKAEQQMSDRFSTLSSEVLSKSTEDLMKRAGEILDHYKKDAEVDSDARKEEIARLIEPLTKQLEELDELQADLERRRSNEVGQLSKQMEELSRSGEDLRKQTLSLTKALHNPGQAGAWGEMVLERIIEMSGLSEGVTYNTQETLKDGGRPDVSILMPGNKVVYIDSKAPLKHYLDALETEDEVLRAQGFQTFASKVDEHVRALSKRKYSDADEAVDFTILFMPSEAAYRVAVETRPRLIEDSFGHKVVIATPSSLFAMLKTIHYAWRHDSLTKEAGEIKRIGAQLYTNISRLAEHYRKLGKSLNTVVGAYNDFGSSLETRTLPSARRLHALGVSDSEPIAPFEATPATTHVLTKPEFNGNISIGELTQLALVGPDIGDD